jgi:plasmid stabilization system protein ParE
VKPARYHPAARDELRAAIRYGEADRPGRGALLEAAVSHVLRRLRRLPPSAPRWSHLRSPFEIRRALVKRHPYLVIYAILPDQLVIIAIAHTSKRPGYWRDRVADLAR